MSGVAEGQQKNLLGAVSDLQQSAGGSEGNTGGKAKLFGGRWKKAGAAAAAGGEAEGGTKSIFGGRWKKPSAPAQAPPMPIDGADAGL